MARLFVENLTVMDFSYLDADRGVVGESWIVDIELTGELDDQGMVFDFGHVKKQIKQFVDAQADHRLLVPAAHPGCRTQMQGEQLRVEFELSSGGCIRHCSPPDAVLLVPEATVEPASISRSLAEELKQTLPGNVHGVSLHFRTESIQGAYYHYTHGLQQHQGQCQRIAHGHRSRLEIQVDGHRNEELEARWMAQFEDVYIASEWHIVKTPVINGIEHTQMVYTAQQGDFEMTLPSDRVVIIPLVSTVENIAVYLAQQTAANLSGEVTVKAFEGPAKGAYGFAKGE